MNEMTAVQVVDPGLRDYGAHQPKADSPSVTHPQARRSPIT
jgi:hypothetical protein